MKPKHRDEAKRDSALKKKSKIFLETEFPLKGPNESYGAECSWVQSDGLGYLWVGTASTCFGHLEKPEYLEALARAILKGLAKQRRFLYKRRAKGAKR